MIYSATTAGQTLPSFIATDKGGSTVISWNVSEEKLTLLVIQKSIDSLNGFKSIASMPDPNTPSNGYVDKNNKDLNFYYRIFYAGVNGKYFFTASKKARIEIIKPVVKIEPKTDTVKEIKGISPPINEFVVNTAAEKIIDSIEILPKKDLIESVLPIKENNTTTNFSINLFTEKVIQESKLTTNPYLYVSKDNNLMLIIPETHKRKFQLQVWREDGTHIFSMKNIKDAQLLIDKSNFIYSGWFKYEISEGEQLKERGKFLIQPD
ncbi:MAG: hypothetical protein RI965_598 [Bacteroidota bacterium]